jgi:DNA-binding HxlR family transcriptional regulator
MIALREKPLRFAEIRRRLDGVSDKMLSQTLRSMERDGLVERYVDDQHPVRIEYRLSPLARTVLPIVTELKRWAECSIDSIEASNHAYDHKIGRSTCQAVSLALDISRLARQPIQRPATATTHYAID